MKNYVIQFFLLGLVLHAPKVFAGTEGHGGGGILCVDLQSGKTTLETLDLWAGRNHGLQIEKTSAVPMPQQIERAIGKMYHTQSSQRETRDAIRHILKKAKFVDVPEFPVPKDTGILKLPSQCRLVGIVNYKSGNFTPDKITVNAPMYAMLSETDKAALWFHEMIFTFCREYQYNGKDSTFAQRFTAIGFSDEDFKTTKWPLPQY